MSMGTHVVGFREPDQAWQKMKAIYDACKAAGVQPPEEVFKYFNWTEPDEKGVEVEIERTACCRIWQSESSSGFSIDLRQLPSDLTHLRFYNSW